jgi:hypothetical protein
MQKNSLNPLLHSNKTGARQNMDIDENRETFKKNMNVVVL